MFFNVLSGMNIESILYNSYKSSHGDTLVKLVSLHDKTTKHVISQRFLLKDGFKRYYTKGNKIALQILHNLWIAPSCCRGCSPQRRAAHAKTLIVGRWSLLYGSSLIILNILGLCDKLLPVRVTLFSIYK